MDHRHFPMPRRADAPPPYPTDSDPDMDEALYRVRAGGAR